jgi:cobalt/nickel transport system permease protein
VFNDVFLGRDSLVSRLDPRTRILAAAAFSVSAAISKDLAAQALAAVIAVALVLAAGLPWRPTCRRLATLNVFLVLLWILLPVTSPGDATLRVGPFTLSAAGLSTALGITLRANAILLAVTALLTTLDLMAFGAALSALRVPKKLTTLLLLTVRYTAVLREEHQRLRHAAQVRCFTPRTDIHSLRTIGQFVGMLLVRGLDRSERVLAAMKCRGYNGRFPSSASLKLSIRDAVFAGSLAAVLGVIFWSERS